MQLEMFFNELSSTPIASEVLSGHQRVNQFVHTMVAATARGVRRVLHIPKDFFSSTIAPNYNWYQWLSDSRIDRETKRYIQSLATKAPFLRGEPDTQAEWAEIDCLWQKKSALGLKAAYVADGLALSLLSRPDWDNPLIECEIQEVVDEDIDCRIDPIHHASRREHIWEHIDWILQRIQTTVLDGKELWRHMSDFFPSLICCTEVEKQMANLPKLALASITRGLFHLNAFCVSWRSGGFDANGVGCNVSPDSPSTLQKYGDQREFTCPGGQRRVFSWHVKAGKWRIYFDPAAGVGHLFIGYVGGHLRTVEFN